MTRWTGWDWRLNAWKRPKPLSPPVTATQALVNATHGRRACLPVRPAGSDQSEHCQKFIDLWQADLVAWRRYLSKLQHSESAERTLDDLGLDYVVSPSPRTR